MVRNGFQPFDNATPNERMTSLSAAEPEFGSPAPPAIQQTTHDRALDLLLLQAHPNINIAYWSLDIPLLHVFTACYLEN